jgi:predicted O-methyltransferase YrrM
VKHFYANIPGWAAFADLYVSQVHLATHTRLSRFVEVGSWLGRSAALMAVEIENSGKPIEFVCVDPWTDGGPDLQNTTYFQDLGVKDVYDIFRRNVRPIEHRIKAMRMTSVEASRFMQDDSVDFLMLDGDHSYEAVRDDIATWMPKMRQRGGVISGDDYLWPGVKQAVDETFGSRATITIKKQHRNYRESSSYWSVLL